MTNAFEDDALGLKLRGYAIVPNGFLEMKIGIYTPEIAESILLEHPEIVDKWLQKLHLEYIKNKKQCDFENDPVACFTLSVYEQFEKSFKSWEDGGLIAITLPQGKVIRVSKRPLITVLSGATSFTCTKCMESFSSIDEFEKHRMMEEEIKVPSKLKTKSFDNSAPNSIWWLAP